MVPPPRPPHPTRPATLDRAADRLVRRRIVLDHWGAALARGDAAEVNRLVLQSRSDRVRPGTIAPLGALLGHAGPTTSVE